MATSVRMSDELEQLLVAAAAVSGESRSQLVRAAVKEHCERLLREQKQTWYDWFVSRNFEPTQGGRKDLSTNKEYLRKVMNERASRRSR